MRFIYLHGFASSPDSTKARAFREALGSGAIEIPQLDGGDFEHLTISGQLRNLEDLLAGEACRLIGSSMGGYLAAIYAAAHPEVDRVVLLAPAFGFSSRWRQMQRPETIANWKETGWLNVYHYGAKQFRRVRYELLEDAEQYPGFPDFTQPALIFHGVNDSVVPIDFSREFVAQHDNARLRELNSDHELVDVLDSITGEAMPFLLS